jgi:hypothetical protein
MKFPWNKRQVAGGSGVKSALEAELGHKLLGTRLDQAQKLTTTIVNTAGEDQESMASILFTRSIVATLGHGEMGDRYPITRQNQEAWRDLVLMLQHAEEAYGLENPYTQAIAKILYRTQIDFVMRSIKAKHTDVEIAMPPNFGQQGGSWRNKQDNLAEQ